MQRLIFAVGYFTPNYVASDGSNLKPYQPHLRVTDPITPQYTGVTIHRDGSARYPGTYSVRLFITALNICPRVKEPHLWHNISPSWRI